jgi:hypothetical protein
MGNRSGAPSHANITNAEMISGQQKKKGGGILIPIDDTIVSKSSTFGHQRRDTHYAQQLDVIPARQLSMHHAIVKKISTDPNIIHLPFLSSMIIGWTSLTFSSRAITK